MRRSHILRPYKSNEMPSDAIWVDTETNPDIQEDGTEKHYLDFGYAVYRRRGAKNKWSAGDWLRFTTIDEYWEWALSKLHGHCKLYMFAHNWAFDAPVLDVFNQLPERKYELIGSVIQSPPVILRWRGKQQTLVLVDTLNIWRMPLKKLGESIGLPKLKMPKRGASRGAWDKYGKRDTEIIMTACIDWWDFLRDNDLGGFAVTIASQAIRTFRHRFMKHPILIDDNVTALELARHSLHGGRTEAFQLGKIKGDVYLLDYNSQYPAIMREHYMPIRLLGIYRNVSIKDTKLWVKKYCLTIKCIVKTSEAVYPIVMNKRLVFPTGEYIAYLSTPEIEYGLKHKLIKKVLECNVYERAKLFRDYVDWMYTYKLKCTAEGNEVRTAMTKLLLTNLYGKFAQKGIIYKKIEDTEDTDIKVWTEYDVEESTTHHFRQYAKIIEEQDRETESRDSHPAIAAHITAHGRMQIWGLMRGCGRGRYYYCDTDSIWVDRAAYEALTPLLDQSKLGFLKLENTSSKVTIWGPKDYIVDDKIVIKGIRKNATKIRGDIYEQARFTTLIGLLRYGDMSAPIVSQITKHLKRDYKKGVVNKDGSITPFVVGLDG